MDPLLEALVVDLAGSVAFGSHHLDHLTPTGDEFVKHVRLLVRQRPYGRAYCLGKVRDDRSIDAVGLGETAGSAGEVADLARIHHNQRQTGSGKLPRHHLLEAASRFEHHQLRMAARRRSTKAATPSPSRANAKVSPEGRTWTSKRSFATSIPTKLCSMTRPCECGLTVRTERLFGFTGTTSGAPGSSTVLKTKTETASRSSPRPAS